MIGERTLPEAARELGVPERTLRRHVAAFGSWVPVRRVGRRGFLAPEAIAVLRLVRDLLAAGRTVAEVRAELAGSAPLHLVAEPEAPAPLARREDVAGVAAELARLRTGVGLLVELLEQERAERRRVLEELQHLREEVERLRAPEALPAEGHANESGPPTRLLEALRRVREGREKA